MTDTEKKLREIRNQLDLVMTYVNTAPIAGITSDHIHVLTNEIEKIHAMSRNLEDQLWGRVD